MTYICIKLSSLAFNEFVFLLVLCLFSELVSFKRKECASSFLTAGTRAWPAQPGAAQLTSLRRMDIWTYAFPVQFCPTLSRLKAAFWVTLGKEPTSSSSFRSSLTWTSLNGLSVCLCCVKVKPLKTQLNRTLLAPKLLLQLFHDDKINFFVWQH